MLETTDARRFGLPHGCRRAAILLAGVLMLGACSSVPDAVNPVSWYRGASDWITGEPSAAQTTARPAVAGEFPSLSTVPQRPEALSPEDRRDITQGLKSDRANARYSDEAIRLEGTPTRSLQPAHGG